MKRNKLQKTVFSVICIVLAVIMMLSLVITVLPAHAVDETDLERLAEKRAQLEEQLMEQEQVIQGLTENQTLIVFRKAALDKQISLNRETIALIEEQIAVYQELIDRKEEELAAATEDWNAGRRFGQVTGTDLPHLVAPDLAGLRLRRPGG